MSIYIKSSSVLLFKTCFIEHLEFALVTDFYIVNSNPISNISIEHHKIIIETVINKLINKKLTSFHLV